MSYPLTDEYFDILIKRKNNLELLQSKLGNLPEQIMSNRDKFPVDLDLEKVRKKVREKIDRAEKLRFTTVVRITEICMSKQPSE